MIAAATPPNCRTTQRRSCCGLGDARGCDNDALWVQPDTECYDDHRYSDATFARRDPRSERRHVRQRWQRYSRCHPRGPEGNGAVRFRRRPWRIFKECRLARMSDGHYCLLRSLGPVKGGNGMKHHEVVIDFNSRGMVELFRRLIYRKKPPAA